MRILVGALALILVSACAKQQPEPVVAVAPYCDVARPIYWSAKDTRYHQGAGRPRECQVEAALRGPRRAATTPG